MRVKLITGLPKIIGELFWGISVSNSLMGSLAKGFLRKVCGNSAGNSRKFAKEIRFIAPGKGAEILRKVCGNLAEICGKFAAMTPSRTTP